MISLIGRPRREGRDVICNRPTNRQEQPRPDRGVTFIEIVITIALMGTVVLGVLAATRASVRASSISREASKVESALLTAAERIERAPRSDATYKCPVSDFSGPVQAAAQLKLGVTLAEAPTYAKVVRYEHLFEGAWVDGACPSATESQENLVQRITISMTSPRTGLTRSWEVLKGDA